MQPAPSFHLSEEHIPLLREEPGQHVPAGDILISVSGTGLAPPLPNWTHTVYFVACFSFIHSMNASSNHARHYTRHNGENVG